MAWLGTYAKRIKVTASNTNVDSDLTHFPLLLTLGTSVGTGSTDVSCVFDELTSDANRTKIAVTKADGTTELYVEIEKWDDANEKAVLWVSKSDWVLDTDANTELYLYYDSAHAANTDRVGDTNDTVAENVWDSSHKMVQHMADGASTSAVYDSTSNDNDGTKSSANNPIEATGKIGEGQDFSSDYVDCNSSSTSSSLDITSEITLEAWIKPDSVTSYQTIFSRRGSNDTGPTQYGIILTNNGKLMQEGGITGGTWWSPGAGTSTISTSAWTYVVVTWKNSDTTYAYYVNGSSDKSGTYATHAITSSAIGVGIGRNLSTGNDFYPEPYDGKIDEVRISSTVRPAAWIKANYYTQTDALVSWGSEEDIPTTTDTGNFFIMF